MAAGKTCSRVMAPNVEKPRQLGVFQSKDDWIDNSGPEPVRTRGRETRHCRKSGGSIETQHDQNERTVCASGTGEYPGCDCETGFTVPIWSAPDFEASADA